MTVAASQRRAGPFLGNGQNMGFTFNFKVFDEADIRVVISDVNGTETELIKDTNYSVNLNAPQSSNPGGQVTYPLPGSGRGILATGERLVIVGDLSLDQMMSLPSGGLFNPENIEDALDRITMLVQQMDEQLARAAQLPVTSLQDPRVFTALVQQLAPLTAELLAIHSNLPAILNVEADLTDINTVAGASSDIATLSPIIQSGDLATLAANTADVTTVAGVSSEVSALAGLSTELTALYALRNAITVLDGIKSAISAVDNNSTDISTVAGIDSDVTKVAGISADVPAVAGNATNINKVAAIDSAISALGVLDSAISALDGIKSDISTVAGISGNVTTVAGLSSGVNTLAGLSSEIANLDSISGHISNVNSIRSAVSTVAGISSDISYVAANAGQIAGSVALAAAWAEGGPQLPAGSKSAKEWAQEAGQIVGAGIIDDTTTSSASTWSSTKIASEIANAGIDDTTTSSSKTWSSNKINSEVSSVASAVAGLIDDTSSSGSSTWSSNEIASYVGGKVAGLIDDAATSSTKVWSSTKVSSELGGRVPTSRQINGKALTSDISLSKGDIGLGNVDNTADANKTVAKADKLTTSRNITVGNRTQGFDGSGSIGFTLAQIGAQAADAQLSDLTNMGTGTGPYQYVTRTSKPTIHLSSKWQIGMNTSDQLVFMYDGDAVACLTAGGAWVCTDDVIGFWVGGIGKTIKE